MRDDMEWFVYIEDFNKRKITKYNIFNHSGFMEDLRKNYKKNKNDYDEFCTKLRRSLMYYFWGKCEWETIISPWVLRDLAKERKIDVYDQVMQNWNVFKDYVWNMCHERKKPERKEKRGGTTGSGAAEDKVLSDLREESQDIPDRQG